jgi:hypothetical protein
MSKGNMKAQNINSTISAESIVIIVESKWIQPKTDTWFVLFVWLNQINAMN